MYKIKLTPVHTEGYPVHGRHDRRKDPKESFFMRPTAGAPHIKVETRAEAQGYVDWYHGQLEDPTSNVKGTKYELRAEVHAMK